MACEKGEREREQINKRCKDTKNEDKKSKENEDIKAKKEGRRNEGKTQRNKQNSV
jgi:hypothetical protein